MSVALGIQHAVRMRRIILPSEACPALQYFSTVSHKRYDFRKKKSYWTQNVCFDFLYKFSLKYFSFQQEMSEILPKMYIGLLVKYWLFLSHFNEIWIFAKLFLSSKNTQISIFVKICTVRAELLHANRRTDIHDEANRPFIFCNFLRTRLIKNKLDNERSIDKRSDYLFWSIA